MGSLGGVSPALHLIGHLLKDESGKVRGFEEAEDHRSASYFCDVVDVVLIA